MKSITWKTGGDDHEIPAHAVVTFNLGSDKATLYIEEKDDGTKSLVITSSSKLKIANRVDPNDN